MVSAFDPALPLERPLVESLTIYGKRLAILLAVVLVNVVLLAILWLNAVSPLFSAIAVTILVVAVVSAFFLRTSEGRLSSVYPLLWVGYLIVLWQHGRERLRGSLNW